MFLLLKHFEMQIDDSIIFADKQAIVQCTGPRRSAIIVEQGEAMITGTIHEKFVKLHEVE